MGLYNFQKVTRLFWVAFFNLLYYTLKTNTIFANTKKPLTLWKKYIDLMIEGKSLRFIAKELHINTTTAFYWRHKILSVLRKNDNDNNKV